MTNYTNLVAAMTAAISSSLGRVMVLIGFLDITSEVSCLQMRQM